MEMMKRIILLLIGLLLLVSISASIGANAQEISTPEPTIEPTPTITPTPTPTITPTPTPTITPTPTPTITPTPTPVPPPTGTITVTTSPVEGKIFIDNKRIGFGSCSREYAIGTYVVSFGDVEGYYPPESLEEIIEANKTKSVAGVYKQKPNGTIHIKTTSDKGNVEGDIYVDGDYVGVGSCTVERTIGTHTVSYSNVKGYKNPSSKSVGVKEGCTINVVGRYEYIPPALVSPNAEILSPKDGATVYSDEWVVLSGRGDDSDGTISEYLWGVDGLVIGHGKDLRYKFRNIGMHTVTLAVIDDDGLSGEDSVEVYVDVRPSIKLSIAPDVLFNISEKAELCITIKTLLPNPSTIVEIQNIEVTGGTVIETESRREILTSFEVMGGKPEVRTISVGANRQGEYSIKLTGYYWLADNPSDPKWVESNEVSFRVLGEGRNPVPPPESHNYRNVFALLGILTILYLTRRKKGRT